MGLLFIAGVHLGCGRMPPPAEPVLDEFAGAIEKGDATRVYELLSARGKEDLDLEDVRQALAADATEMKALAADLRKKKDLQVDAWVDTADGERLRLVEEEGRFRLAEPWGVLAEPRSTQAFLAALSVSLRRGRASGFYALLSDVRQKELGRVVDGLIAALEPGSGYLVRPESRGYVVRLESGVELVVVVEGGVHRLEEIH